MNCFTTLFHPQSSIETPMEEYPLHRFCRDGHAESLFNLLISGQYSIFTEDSLYGWTPAHWAAHFNQSLCFEALFKQTAFSKSTDIQVSGTRQTPLHVAAESGAIDAVRWLAAKRADPNQKDYLGETALHKAARSGHVEAILILSTVGARPNIKNLRGETALDLAHHNGHEQAINSLYCLQRAVPSDHYNDDVETEMEAACDYHDTVAVPRRPKLPIDFNWASESHKRGRTLDEEENNGKRMRLSGAGGFIPNFFLFAESPGKLKKSDKMHFKKAVDEGYGFNDDSMKTISSCINGHQAGEDISMLESTSSGSSLPANLIPPLQEDGLESTGRPLRSKCFWFRNSCYI